MCLCLLGSACYQATSREDPAADGGALPGEPELPSWAVEVGLDQYGTWADFEVEGHRTRLRKIPKGSFLMGSSEAEPGRGPDEQQHEVSLTHDYWLAASECTQALWQLVMDGNPSYFVSAERPVEDVTWPDVQEFLTRLNERVPRLNARLPTEAEWEYGSRAGTTSETYAGELNVLGTYNAPILDDISWYGGNGGLDFELDNGIASSTWPDKQYSHETAGSHPVMHKDPNAWGLYDSLGNLWEWCQDWFGPYDAEPAVDPQGAATGDSRVIRGGSWMNNAIDMRVANRNRATPVDKVIVLGFRIAVGSNE